MDWILRFIKGAVSGTGFPLPGISGGALAVVFGLYERIIGFLANIKKNFIGNVLFFIPVGLGGLFGIVILSHPLSFCLENYEAQVLWLFVGAIVGTMPELWSKSGKKGRKPYHWVIIFLTFALAFLFLSSAEELLITEIPLNFITWALAGVLVALSGLIPGFASSNFLVLLGIYKPMVNAYKSLDHNVLIPFFIGFGISLFPLSKGINFLIDRKYTGFFHFVLGLVLASTLLIVPTDYGYLQNPLGSLGCFASLLVGAVLAYWMCKKGG